MLRDYELFYIVRPDLEEEQVRTTMDEVAELVAGHGGEVTKSSLWGRRRLAYTVAGFTDGYYALKEISLPGEKLRDLERQLKLDERVIRQLITLRQVYLLPEGEDRRGRVRTKSRDRAAAAAAELDPDEVELADGIVEDEIEDIAEVEEIEEIAEMEEMPVSEEDGPEAVGPGLEAGEE